MSKSKKKSTPYTDSAKKVFGTNKSNLQLLWDNIVKGQQKQIIKNEDVKAMFDFYGVEYIE